MTERMIYRAWGTSVGNLNIKDRKFHFTDWQDSTLTRLDSTTYSPYRLFSMGKAHSVSRQVKNNIVSFESKRFFYKIMNSKTC